MKLYQIIFGLILFSFPVFAGPYCVNGSVGGLEVNITSVGESEHLGVWVIREDGSVESYFESYIENKENRSLEVWINASLTYLNGSVIFEEYVEYRGIDSYEKIYVNEDLEKSLNLTEGNYTLVLKVYEWDDDNDTSLEQTNCDDDSEKVKVELLRRVNLKNMAITPDVLGCGIRNFTIDIEVENDGLGNISELQVNLKNTDYLDVEHIFQNFSLAVNQSVNLSYDFELPGFHLYKHYFGVDFEGDFHEAYGKCVQILGSGIISCHNVHNELKIDKCPTDNAQNLQKEVPKLKRALERVENVIKHLFQCLSIQGISC